MQPIYSIPGGGIYRRYVRADDKSGITLNKPIPQSKEYLRTHGSYAALLFDPKWRSRRAEILERDKHSCVICTGQDSLQVHHRQYHFVFKEQGFKPPWDYADNLLITLCERCHRRGHSKYLVPTINI